MSVTIRRVSSRKEVKDFVKVPFSIYKDNPYWVPPLIRDEMEIFDPRKNPAFEYADCRLFIAEKDGCPVGRVAAIDNRAANEKYNVRNLRFGWFDTIDDIEVAKALFDAVEAYAAELGMETITGPHGFCDLDPQGMQVEGFDKLATISGYYNFPYYRPLVEQCGYEKEIDYVEFLTQVPHETGIPEKLVRLSERVLERSKLRLLKFRNRKEIVKRGEELFHLLDEAFENIYGSVPLNEHQIQYYVKKYISFVDKDLIKAVVNEEDRMIGFMITMPSLSRAFQKARGRLLPFGWYHILKSIKSNDILDFYLAGVDEHYRGLGVDLLMVVSITQTALQKGFKCAESNQELETNAKVQAQWKYFNPQNHKRRRIFKKILSK